MARALKRQASWTWLAACCCVVLLTFSTESQANGDFLSSPGEVHSGGLVLRVASGYQLATRLNTDIEIEANGLIARVLVKQRFRNDSQSWVEGVYTFPLPDNAAVDHMRLHIGERFIEGDIREKEQAKKIYEQAKAAGKKATLVNQQRANLFTTAIANIAPGEAITVEIEYQQTLRYEAGEFSLRFPLTLTPRYIPGTPTHDRKGSGWSADTHRVPDGSLITPPMIEKSNDHKVTLQADINAGVPLEYVVSRYHPINVQERNQHFMLSFADSDVPMDHDLELVWRPTASSVTRAAVFSEKTETATHLLLMLVPPDNSAEPAIIMPRELIFVIDTSGSMHGTSIQQARGALLTALGGLRPSDRFNVIQFNSVTHALFNESKEASAVNLRQANAYVRSLQANGGTEMRPAILHALRGRADEAYLRQVVFITDGSVGNEEELFGVIESELGAARLFTVGIGSAPNGWFMTKAAEVGRGSQTTISAMHEVQEKMADLFNKIERPQITNIDVQWPAGAIVESYPATIPDLYAGEPLVIQAKLAKAVTKRDKLLVTGNAGSREWRASVALGSSEKNAGVSTLWARARIADLENLRRRGANQQLIRQQITATAIAHHLVSRYTSLVAVDKTPVRPAAEVLESGLVPNLLPHGQNAQAMAGMVKSGTAGPMNRVVGVLCLLLAALLMIRRSRHALANR